MIEQLFGSKTRVKLLHLFTNNPNRAFYVREITRKIDEQINSVRRELSNLLSIGVISSESANNRLYYEVNQNYEHYNSLRAIFSEADEDVVAAKASTKTTKKKAARTTDDEMTKRVKSLGAVEVALLTGSFTRDTNAPVDFMIVGDINKTQLVNFIKELEASENRELRYVHMPQHEYLYRLDVNDRFMADIIASKKTVIVDKSGKLE